jgi:drug/metabolite transporter (DMT)-like permease
MPVAVETPKNSDAAVALLRWILAGLILLNGVAWVVSAKGPGGLLGGYRADYAAGLACALVGGLCWALSHAAISHEDGEEEWNGARPEQRGARDRAIAFGALAIMLWVASLTTFITGCEHLSWSPVADHKLTPLHAAGTTEPVTPRRPASV